MLSEETHTCGHTLRDTHRALSTRGLTRYSSAICDEYCCIPCTQYAQHISHLISLLLSLTACLLDPLSLSPSLPQFSLIFSIVTRNHLLVTVFVCPTHVLASPLTKCIFVSDFWESSCYSCLSAPRHHVDYQ